LLLVQEKRIAANVMAQQWTARGGVSNLNHHLPEPERGGERKSEPLCACRLRQRRDSSPFFPSLGCCSCSIQFIEEVGCCDARSNLGQLWFEGVQSLTPWLSKASKLQSTLRIKASQKSKPNLQSFLWIVWCVPLKWPLK
jgi:hypothetical protein